MCSVGTEEELGGSEYYAQLGVSGVAVPRLDAEMAKARYCRLSNAIAHGLVASAYPVNHGGLGVALAKVAIAGQLGMDITLPGRMRQDAFLFSETLGRIIVTVAPDHKRAFEQTVSADAILLGKTGGTKLRITGQEALRGSGN